MNYDHSDIPGEIFEWLEQKPFASLSNSQQQLVLQYYTAQEYDALHETLSGSVAPGAFSNPDERMKSELMETFRATYPESNKIRKIIQYRVEWWKAAILLATTGIMFALYSQRIKNLYMHEALQIKHDTVYVQANANTAIAAPVPVSRAKQEQSAIIAHVHRKTAGSKNTHAMSRADFDEPLHIVNYNQLQNTVNTKKGGSLNDDTLLNFVGYVRL